MSVATELVPEFQIPERARTRVPQRLASVTVLHAPAVPSAPSIIRLTHRGVVVLALAVLALGVGLVWLAKLSAPQASAAPPAPHTVVVQPGDTLWAIAGRVAPQADPRAEVAALQRRNHLLAVDLVPGQVLRVP
jgi:nucleoid-associated protein YgaU